MFYLRFFDADVMEIGGAENNGKIALFLFADHLGVAGHPGGVADAFKISAEVPFDGNGHPVLEQVFPAGQEFRRQAAKTLFGIFTVRSAAKIHLGVEHPFAAFFAAAAGFVFEKFHVTAAFGAGGFKNGPWLPVAGILSGALHRFTPVVKSTARRGRQGVLRGREGYFPPPRLSIELIPGSPSDPHPQW